MGVLLTWLVRSLRAAGDPHTFDDCVAKIKTLMSAVQTRCEALLAERCKRIETASISEWLSTHVLRMTLKRCSQIFLAIARISKMSYVVSFQAYCNSRAI